MDWITTLFYGDEKSIKLITADTELKTLKNLISSAQNRAFQFNTANNLMWAFGRYNDKVLEHTLKLFLSGTFSGYIFKHHLLDEFVKNYDVFLKRLEYIPLGDSEGKEKYILMKVIKNIDIKYVVETIVQFLQGDIQKDEMCKVLNRTNLCDGNNIVRCEDFCDDVFLLLSSVIGKESLY